MSYAKSVLQPGETIVRMGYLHWIAYWPAILFLVLGVLLVWWEWRVDANDLLISFTALTFGALFLIAFVRAWFIRWITEIAITNRRVIYKFGFINRRTEEMNMDKVTSVDVNQSILGRMLDYGDIHVIGSAGGIISDEGHDGIEHLHRIAQPLELRNAIIAK